MAAVRNPAGKSCNLHWSAATDAGRVRDRNEDAHAVIPLPEPVGGCLFVVADGVGGQRAGDVASSMALEQLRGILPAWAGQCSQVPLADDVGRALARSLQQINDYLLHEASRRPEWRGMATTLTVVWVLGQTFRYAHVGDSRLYLFRDGQLEQLSHDHALASELVRSGEITQEQARSHPARHVLTQAIGIPGELEVDTGAGSLLPGDVLLLCTDGLMAVMDEKEVGDLLSRTSSGQAAQLLVQVANERGAPDNVTAITVFCSGDNTVIQEVEDR